MAGHVIHSVLERLRIDRQHDASPVTGWQLRWREQAFGYLPNARSCKDVAGNKAAPRSSRAVVRCVPAARVPCFCVPLRRARAITTLSILGDAMQPVVLPSLVAHSNAHCATSRMQTGRRPGSEFGMPLAPWRAPASGPYRYHLPGPKPLTIAACSLVLSLCIKACRVRLEPRFRLPASLGRYFSSSVTPENLRFFVRMERYAGDPCSTLRCTARCYTPGGNTPGGMRALLRVADHTPLLKELAVFLSLGGL
jgi:hypothetical protein